MAIISHSAVNMPLLYSISALAHLPPVYKSGKPASWWACPLYVIPGGMVELSCTGALII